MRELSLKEKIGQMFIIKMFGSSITPEIIKLIEEYKIGGIILYKKNYKTYKDMINIINNIKEINKKAGNIPMFISIDQEGGRVNRMPEEIKNLKSAKKFAQTENIEIVKKSGNIIAEILKQSGYNMNFSPVFDIQRFEDNHAIGDRCYGYNKENVYKYGIEVMRELTKQKIIPVIKHFPGHGATKKDSHFFLPKINKTIEEIEKDDMIPFNKAINEGADAIMVGHLILKDVDKIYPTSLSKKFIQEYIREKYKFNGLIITDDLKMRAVSLFFGYNKAIIKAINAGIDIIMIGATYETVIFAINKIIKKINNQKIDLNNINASIERILKIKEKYNLVDEFSNGCNVIEINKKIDEVNNQVENLYKELHNIEVELL